MAPAVEPPVAQGEQSPTTSTLTLHAALNVFIGQFVQVVPSPYCPLLHILGAEMQGGECGISHLGIPNA